MLIFPRALGTPLGAYNNTIHLHLPYPLQYPDLYKGSIVTSSTTSTSPQTTSIATLFTTSTTTYITTFAAIIFPKRPKTKFTKSSRIPFLEKWSSIFVPFKINTKVHPLIQIPPVQPYSILHDQHQTSTQLKNVTYYQEPCSQKYIIYHNNCCYYHYTDCNTRPDEPSHLLPSHNASQNKLRAIYKIKESRTFMESLITDFIQFSCAIANFEIFLEFPRFLRSLIIT